MYKFNGTIPVSIIFQKLMKFFRKRYQAISLSLSLSLIFCMAVIKNKAGLINFSDVINAFRKSIDKLKKLLTSLK